MSTEVEQANRWITSRDVGLSSKTIWSVMMGCPMERGSMGASVPLDPDDFSRCWKLLVYIPEWRSRLSEVVQQYPEWGPLVREWAVLERIYIEAFPSGRAPEMYDLMQTLIAEGRNGF